MPNSSHESGRLGSVNSDPCLLSNSVLTTKWGE